jgi:hypothetical protein
VSINVTGVIGKRARTLIGIKNNINRIIGRGIDRISLNDLRIQHMKTMQKKYGEKILFTEKI